MSTNNTTINISQKNIYGNCDLKCAYNFNYGSSNSTAKNEGMGIVLTYDNGSIPPVTFNDKKYTVEAIYISSPSLHTFNGDKCSGEIIIIHNPQLGGEKLMVCIPIIQSSDPTTASNMLEQIIQTVASNAPSTGNSTNLNMNNFTLQNFIPKKPFYNYTGLFGSSTSNFIVFGTEHAIPLNSQTLDKLGKIIKPFPLPMTGEKLFYNKTGPNTSISKDDLYISCQPTGESEEQIEVINEKPHTSFDLGSIVNNPAMLLLIKILLGCLLFIIVFFILNYIFNYFTSDAPKQFNLSIPKFPGFTKK